MRIETVDIFRSMKNIKQLLLSLTLFICAFEISYAMGEESPSVAKLLSEKTGLEAIPVDADSVVLMYEFKDRSGMGRLPPRLKSIIEGVAEGLTESELHSHIMINTVVGAEGRSAVSGKVMEKERKLHSHLKNIVKQYEGEDSLIFSVTKMGRAETNKLVITVMGWRSDPGQVVQYVHNNYFAEN